MPTSCYYEDVPETADVTTGETYREHAVVSTVAVTRVGDVVDPVTGEVTHHRVDG